MLIVTNGDSAAGRIADLGLDADILPWRDVLHDGPVLPGPAFVEERAAFLAAMSGQPAADIVADMAARDRGFEAACRARRVELWFEHDLYDQLQIAQILTMAAPWQGDLYLAQANENLCEMSDAAFARMPYGGRPVTSADYAYAATVWDAFAAPDPTMLNRLAMTSAPLSWLQAAIQRQLAEYPDVQSGLSQSMMTALRPLKSEPLLLGRRKPCDPKWHRPMDRWRASKRE
ncbi:MAG: hypothetical protein ACKVH0_17210 [Alphaproteobacteria bacterium]